VKNYVEEDEKNSILQKLESFPEKQPVEILQQD